MNYTPGEYWRFRWACYERGISLGLVYYYMMCRNLTAAQALTSARRLKAREATS